MNLSETGLDGDPFETQIPASSPYFDGLLLSGTANVLQFGASGALWKLGTAVIDQLKRLKREEPVAESVDVSVDDVSNCSPGNPSCGPGYSSAKGIRPQLCFHLSWSNSLPGQPSMTSSAFPPTTHWPGSSRKRKRAG